MMQVLRRTFSRRGRRRQQTTTDGRSNVISESGVHIPAPERRRTKSLLTARVIMLDGTDVSVDIHKKALGKVLYQQVISYHLDLIEVDYFGLQYVDANQVSQWLDLNKKVSKQLKQAPPYTFHFCVKFYSSEPNLLQEELTRYHFFLQLKQDLRRGKLTCPFNEAVQLAAFSLQSELGDYDPEVHTPYFISEFRFIPQQTEDFELAVTETYKNIRGQRPAEAELNYLNIAKWAEMYGVDMHQVKGKDGNDYRLGLTPTGILVFESDQKIGLFFWPNIKKLDFRGKRLMLIVSEDNDKGIEQQHSFIFRLDHPKACKHLWKCAVEHHAFFRLKSNRKSQQQRPAMVRLGSRFRPSVRTEYEITRKHGPRKSVNFERRPSKRYSRRSSFQKHMAQRPLPTSDDPFVRHVPQDGPAAPPSVPQKRSDRPSTSSRKRSTRNSSSSSNKAASYARSSARHAYGIEV